MKTIGTNILVEVKAQEKGERLSAGGIVIPDSAEQEENDYETGTVLSVGKKVEEVKKGNKVIFHQKYAGDEIEENKFVLDEKKVLVVL